MSSRPATDETFDIELLREELSPILAESGQTFDRLRTVFTIAVQQNPDILKCTPESLRREMSKCAADGLVPDSKEAVLLPYYDKDAKAHLANYQPMVHGVIKRLRELGGVFQIVCNLVYENDVYEENEADPESLVHKSPGFGKPRGDVVGGYVIFRDDQKRIMHFEKMSRADFDRVRQASKSPNSPAWRQWFEEMCRKAVLRRGSKYLSTNNDKIRALIERTDSMFLDLKASQPVERVNPFTGEIEGGGTRALEHNPGQSMPVDMQQGREKQPAGQQQDRKTEPKQQKKTEPSSSKADTGSQTVDQKKELPDAPPPIPETEIFPGDTEKVTEVAQKVFAVANDRTLDPPGRRGVLKTSVADWKAYLPETMHDLLKAMIAVTDWSVRRDAEGKAWAAEHAMAVHKVKSMLGVEKLEVGSYP